MRKKSRGNSRPKPKREDRPAPGPGPSAKAPEPELKPVVAEEAPAPEPEPEPVVAEEAPAAEPAAEPEAAPAGPLSIQDDVAAQMKVAMKARETAKLTALRGIKAALTTAMKESNAETLSDAEAVPVLRKLAKQRSESIESYKSAGADDRAASEQAELDLISQWLPQLATEETVTGWAQEVIAATGASSPAEMGKVMGMLMKDHKDEMDGKMAQQIVKNLLVGA
mmetsp:Transcript_43328/g.135713  ORF Transcript_43328/g.135713 Transcript_43328/m.135713 type:complete len:224 (+) Transcript_43328:551-1222(+)